MYKIAYVTSSRADYGIVRNYLKKLNEDKDINLDILVTGALLDKKYGESYHMIEEDGFNIAEMVKIDAINTNNSTIINSMSLVLKEFGKIFCKNHYDLVIVLGDRYEMLSVAIAAAMNRLKILHIHGGEKTVGNYDEFIRHCITKMSLYHFTSTEEYKHRVIQLGENPENVFNIGAMGTENCKMIDIKNVLTSIEEMKDKKYFVVLFHPETLNEINPGEQMQILLNVIDRYIEEYEFIFLGNNSDTGSDEIRKLIKEYISKKDNAKYFENLHPDSYHYLLKNSIALIGNSSSGIIEAPTLGIYTINIGDRQKGRVKGKSVISIPCNFENINEAIKLSINSKKEEFDNPYFKENASENAYIITKKILKKDDSIMKEFIDI